jgi:hypothetical protein
MNLHTNILKMMAMGKCTITSFDLETLTTADEFAFEKKIHACFW